MFIIPSSVFHTLLKIFAQVVAALFPSGAVTTTPWGVSLTNRVVSMFEIIKLANRPCLKPGTPLYCRKCLIPSGEHLRVRQQIVEHVLAWTDDNHTFILSQC